MYTKIMELNYWNSTVCQSADYDEETGEWTVTVEREGETVVLRPKQLVLATGMSAVPNMPEFSGAENFKGVQHHSSKHPGGDPYKGKKCVVIGSNNYGFSGWGGITVFGHNGDGWPKSGATWHVHDFAVSNINPDGSVPANPIPPWQEYNVYRARPAVDDPAYPDVAGIIRDLCVADCDDGPVKISVQVENEGSRTLAAGTPWAFYKVDGTGNTLVTTGTLPEVPSGEAPEGFVIEVAPTDLGEFGFVIVLDDDGTGAGDDGGAAEASPRGHRLRG